MNSINYLIDPSRSQRDEYTECLESLGAQAYNPRFTAIETAHRESYHWIWDEGPSGPGFVDWLKIGTGIYWISGKPGAGKSTLMKYVYKDDRLKCILSSMNNRQSILVGYFFHELGQPLEGTFVGLLSAMLQQLLSQCRDLARFILPIFQSLKANPHIERRLEWPETALRDALWEISKQQDVEATVCLFIDGYDECECEDSRRDQLDEFLVPWIESFRDKPLSMKVCLASRRLFEIELHLSQYPGFRIHERTAEDIFSYVSSKLHQTTKLLAKKHNNRNFRTRVRDELIQNIVNKAEGVFLWVKLVVKEISSGLEAGNSDLELQSRLDSLPEGIRDLYAKILRDINPRYWDGTLNYTQMLCCSPGHNTPSLLEFSFAEDSFEIISQHQHKSYLREHPLRERCDKTKDRIQSRCGVLLEVRSGSGLDLYNERGSVVGPENVADDNPDNGGHFPSKDIDFGNDYKVVFVHRTAKEYLLEKETKALLFGRVHPDSVTNPNIALLKGHVGSLLANHAWWPPWKDNKIPLFVWDWITQLFLFASKLDILSTSLYKHYIALLDHVYSTADKNWHYDYFNQCLSRPLGDDSRGGMDMLRLAVYWGLKNFILEEVGENCAIRANKDPLLTYAIDCFLFSDPHEIEIFSILFEAGSSPGDEFNSWSCWEYAIWRIHRRRDIIDHELWQKIFNLFLEYRADPNLKLRDRPGLSQWGFFKTAGNDVDESDDEEGNVKPRKDDFVTPIHWIILDFFQKTPESPKMRKAGDALLKLFLDYGADPSLEDSNRDTAFTVAERQDPGLKDYILNYWTECKVRKSSQVGHQEGSTSPLPSHYGTREM